MRSAAALESWPAAGDGLVDCAKTAEARSIAAQIKPRPNKFWELRPKRFRELRGMGFIVSRRWSGFGGAPYLQLPARQNRSRRRCMSGQPWRVLWPGDRFPAWAVPGWREKH